MLFYPTFFETAVILVLYMLTYNLALFLLFWTISQFTHLATKTIYNLSSLRLHPSSVATLTLLFFSMAGVPPFLGFFAKLLILLTLLHSSFVFLYFAFFILLLFSLYFYMQNMRFLHSTLSNKKIYPSTKTRLSVVYTYSNLIFSLFFMVGFAYIDDIFLITNWLCL